MYKILISSSFIALLFMGCSNYKEAKQTITNEINQANTCINTKNEELENDCYDLISYKNSIALLRLGKKAYYKGNYTEALQRYKLAQIRKNFYANALLSQLYMKGYGVKQNQDKALELLEDVKDVDPIAAYKLSLYYIKQENYKKAVDLLEYASKNHLKEAQYKLLQLYKNKSLETNPKKVKDLLLKYKDKSKDFKKYLYGL